MDTLYGFQKKKKAMEISNHEVKVCSILELVQYIISNTTLIFIMFTDVYRHSLADCLQWQEFALLRLPQIRTVRTGHVASD